MLAVVGRASAFWARANDPSVFDDSGVPSAATSAATGPRRAAIDCARRLQSAR